MFYDVLRDQLQPIQAPDPKSNQKHKEQFAGIQKICAKGRSTKKEDDFGFSHLKAKLFA